MTRRPCMIFVYPPMSAALTYSFSEKGLREAQARARTISRFSKSGAPVRIDVNCAMGAVKHLFHCSKTGCYAPEPSEADEAAAMRGRGISIAGAPRRKRQSKSRRRKG